MYTLGIYDGHNAGCSLVKEGEVLFSIEEERLSRIKGHDGRRDDCGLPIRSLRLILDNLNEGIKISKIAIGLQDSIALHKSSLFHWVKDFEDNKNLIKPDIDNKKIRNKQQKLEISQNLYCDFPFGTQEHRIKRLIDLIKDFNLSECVIEYVPHHLAHHASSWFVANKNKKKSGLAISLDGRGDALSGRVSICSKDKIKPIHEISSFNSIGHFYSAITVALGFKAVKHEGKITGLAAFGSPDKCLLEKFNKLIFFNFDLGSISSDKCLYNESAPYPWANFKFYVDKFKNILTGHSKEVIAATAQLHLERVVCKFVSFWMAKTKLKDVYLSGGVFSNVKLNQKISEIENIKSLIVHPGMTDCGISLGSALYVNRQKSTKIRKNYYLGAPNRHECINDVISNYEIKTIKPKNISEIVAIALKDKKIVARYAGLAEYGPRALGNRSILYHAGDKSINTSLNKRLSRTEFMPFAPVTIDEDEKKSFKTPKNVDISESMKYMTITVNCTAYMIKNCPAVVHVDKTARPQIISSKQNYEFYQILKEYKKITGIGSLVNTSFNLHDEPIVETPEDALRSFIIAGLDLLILGENLIYKKDVKHLSRKWK